MSTRPTLAAEHRTVTGKKVATLRRAGTLPAVIFGGGKASEPIQVSALDWEVLRRGKVTRNSLVDLVVDGGTPRPVLVQSITDHPTSRKPIHVDFQIIRMSEELTVDVPVVFVGEAPAVEKDGGTLIHLREQLHIRALPGTLGMNTGNLPSGYHRDMQELKDLVIPAGAELKSCLRLATDAIGYLEVRRNILEDERYRDLFSVERVNQLVLEGVPFRDAYRRVAEEIRDGTFQPTGALRHSHAGSIGNLRNDGISQRMQELQRPFEAAETRIQACYRDLLGR